MTRKHYNMLAEMFQQAKPDSHLEPAVYELWLCLVHRLADQLKRDNPNFKHERFFNACGA